MRCTLALLCAALTAWAAGRVFTSYASVKPVLEAEQANLPAALKNANEAKWISWSRRQDKAIRERLQQGDLDSMVNLLLYGTSFTKQPRVEIENLTEASKSGVLRARVDDLIAGLRSPGDNERLVFLNGLLRSQGADPASSGAETGRFIYSNLLRVLEESKTYAARSAAATEAVRKSADPASVLDRASLFYDRGVSLDTGIIPNFSIEQTLADMKHRGLLHEGQVRRVAVVGPGLDFIDKKEQAAYDYYPQQTLQPFAFYDSLIRLGLAKPNALSVSVFDISAQVIDHLQRARERARKNGGYVIQLPHDIARPWPPALAAYWKSLGDRAGMPVQPIQPPEVFRATNSGRDLETRAVEIRPAVVLALEPVNLNIVVEHMDLAPADRFDLIVGTNIFVYYDAFEQALALENAGAMLKPGGFLLSNDRLPEVRGGTMRLAGLTEVRIDGRSVSDAVGWYQRR